LWKSHAMPRTEQTGDGGVIKVTSSYGTVEGTTFIVGMTGDASNVKELFLCGAKEPLRSVVLSDSNLKGRDTNFKHFLRIDCPPNRPMSINGYSQTCPSLNPGQHSNDKIMNQQLGKTERPFELQ
jgi:hypothetical protein